MRELENGTLASAAMVEPDLRDPSLYVNRELSWIDFNQRVLEEALDSAAHPLLERIKFISIFSSNLDEFFMIRVAGLDDQCAEGITERSVDGLTPMEMVERIRERVIEQIRQRNVCFFEEIIPALKRRGIEFVSPSSLSEHQQQVLRDYFRKEIFPVLTPLAFDTGHPFPFMSNLSLNLAIELEDEECGSIKFARVKVPGILSRIIRLDQIEGLGFGDDRIRLLLLEDLVEHNLDQLFPRMRILQCHPFRIIRDADIEIEEDEAGDLLESIEQGVRSRRYGKVVRLDINPDMPHSIRSLLVKNLETYERNVYEIGGVLGMSALIELLKIDRPDLKDELFVPNNPLDDKRTADIFAEMRSGDMLLHHPYDSFKPVVDLIWQAARDPDVLSIKQTLYRVGSNSPVVKALMFAAEQRKQVAVLVELKARFDEENNILWARALEDAGAHVVYGLPGLKTHAKLTMIVRREQEGLRHYLHLGTGNYNTVTARIYTDYSYLTTDPVLADDVTELFNSLTGYSKHREYRSLIVSPLNTRRWIMEMIRHEVEHQKHTGNGRIVMKMNALVDEEIIRALYRASMTGVKIDLVIRGICCLKPGIPGISENIRVISVIGRFLEHSRVYYFNNGDQARIFLGSADIMPRNLDKRVETLFPVIEPRLVESIKSDLELTLGDNRKSWQMQPDGTYIRKRGGRPAVDSQRLFMRRSLRRKKNIKTKVKGL
ncbi:polyphosphate kinase 1 [Chlorobaculum sp. MV4-Y]|uniref:polyphosphate kinase 1 n=1 Tax=Chlorobaculum sp. MV4-Y TaxID=2976335 RepID=UPI0021B005E1|nr:polyphosphate kinase 1 [Chlorobaculum sp. MV4-Y]UWX58507.1 polyphosphate kinase 1 [Chlorobaculum sp. MV4-Y]